MAADNKSTSKEDFIYCLSQQLSELEILLSMYSKQNEIMFTDSNILENLKTFVNGQSDYVPGHLDFTLNLCIDSLKLEFCINLPTLYPNVEPDIHIRCNQLNRHEQTKLNLDLSNFMKTIELGDPFLYSIVTWIQDNINNYNEISKSSDKIVSKEIEADKGNFTRLWIYSHHIYSKRKRDNISSIARDLNLGGFCLPGKPGVICVEGSESSCREWWQMIKSMNWKKIMIRKTETFDSTDLLKYKKFDGFTEKVFQSTSSRGKRHTDMSEFSKYMEHHGLSEIFNDVFGIL